MKRYEFIAAILFSAGTLALQSCSDYDYDTQLSRTDISGFSVKSSTGNT